MLLPLLWCSLCAPSSGRAAPSTPLPAAVVSALEKAKEAGAKALEKTKEVATDAKNAIGDKLTEWHLTGADIKAINANDGPLPVTGKIHYFVDDPNTQGDPDTGEGYEQSGCLADSYAYNDFQAGEIAVVEPQGGGRFRIVARIRKETWPALVRAGT